ncbi:tetratricopeptide repeat protein [Ekhidna sp.]|uniref:tetratricopeptide repeat protein n=1 Tax=Ekhidna sp. TaxID=2608089 RepID=UPI003CCBB6BA
MRKNMILILGLLCAAVAMANGQFEKAMSESIPAMFSAQNPDDLQNAINKLDRIGEAEGDRWEPYYYAAFGYLRMSGMFEKAEEKDKYLDLAMKQVEKGEAINPNDSELEAMRGYIHMIKLTVDPATRGMMYSGLAFTSFQKAIKLNPENPRAHFLLGRMQHGTAQFMGGGSEDACASLFKAKVLFMKGEETENPFAPSWGQDGTEESIQQICENGE